MPHARGPAAAAGALSFLLRDFSGGAARVVVAGWDVAAHVGRSHRRGLRPDRRCACGSGHFHCRILLRASRRPADLPMMRPGSAPMTLRPDPSFYPSPRMAQEAPPEKFAYVAAIDPAGIAGAKVGEPDALAVVDLDPASSGYGTIASLTQMPHVGDELHHFGWN